MKLVLEERDEIVGLYDSRYTWPNDKLFASGLYDLCTTAGMSKYLAAHSNLDMNRVKIGVYPSGHMAYLGEENFKERVNEMKLISWNVNGLRACIKKDFFGFLESIDADIFCLQETKMQPEQADFTLDGYHQYWNSAVKKGYSGTLIFSRQAPIDVSYDIGIEEHKGEGRVITLEFKNFFIVNVYTPNSQRGLERLDYRMAWEDAFSEYVNTLSNKKTTIICGDLNVAHNEIDIKNPKSNTMSAGFTIQERNKLTALLNSGFEDSFRMLYPELRGAYTWWSYMHNARPNNAGWRLDYFLVSSKDKARINDATIYSDIIGSDHCPVGLIIDL